MSDSDSDHELSSYPSPKGDEQEAASSSSSSSHVQQAETSHNPLGSRHIDVVSDDKTGGESSSKREYSTLPVSSSPATGGAPTKKLRTDNTELPAADGSDTAVLRQTQSLLLFDPSSHQDDGPLSTSSFTEVLRPSLSWLNNQSHDTDSFEAYKRSVSQLRRTYIFSKEKLAHMDESAQNKMLTDFATVLSSTEVHLVKNEAGFSSISHVYEIEGLLKNLLLWLNNSSIDQSHSLKAKTLLNLGCVFFNFGKIEEALAYWKQLCEMTIVDVDLDQRLSITIQICQLILLQYQLNNQDAVKQLEQAKELAHRYVPELYRTTFFGQISLLLASALLDANRFDDAKKEIKVAKTIFNHDFYNKKHPLFIRRKELSKIISHIQIISFNNAYTVDSVEFRDATYNALIAALTHPCSKLIELAIDNCDFTFIDLTSLTPVFKDPHCEIKTLTLSNSFMDTGVEAFLDAVIAANLTSVTLLCMQPLGRMSEERAFGIKHFGNQLVNLALVDVSLDKYDVRELAWVLIKPSNVLAKLDLSMNFCGDGGAQALAKIALVDEHCKLTELDLSDNEIGDKGACALAIALVNENCQLTHLRLDKNQIGDVGIQALAKALAHPNCKLTDISLSGNPIGVEGLKALAEALKSPACKLTALHLEDIDMDEASLQTLVEVLQHPDCKITHLYLGGRTISDKTCQVLAAALQSTDCKLTHLYFKGSNQITDVGAKALADVLPHENCKLEVLSLLLKPALAAILVRAMERNHSLLESDFGLTQYDCNAPGINEYKKYLARNQHNKTQREELLFTKRLPWAFFNEATDVLGTGEFKLAEPKTSTTNNAIGQDALTDDKVIVPQAASSGL